MADLMPEEAGQPWVDLVPTHVLHSVALRLSPLDLSSFQKVCKPWRSHQIESYPLGRSPLFLFRKRIDPPCRQYSGDDDGLLLYSPLYNMTFSWAVSGEVHDILNWNTSCIMYSKDGWLVTLRRTDILFVNPFLPSTAAALIKWRKPPRFCLHLETSVCMSAPPTDPTCIFLFINNKHYGIELSIGSDGGTTWKDDFIEDAVRAVSVLYRINPVSRDGAFYILMRSGALGIYDPRRRTWAIHHPRITMPSYGFLAESNGELLSIYKFGRDESLMDSPLSYKYVGDPLAYKLKESNMEWEELTDLRGRALFLDGRSAILAAAEVDGMKDRIFTDKFRFSMKVDCELHRSAGGDPRLVPGPHVGFAELARRAEGKSVELSFLYSSHGAAKEARYGGRWTGRIGVWIQPNWGQQ